MSNPNDTVTSLNSPGAEMSLLKHPLLSAMDRRHALGATAGQLRHPVLPAYRGFPRYLSALHSRCEDLETRQVLLENLIDEECRAENHPELWPRLHRLSA
jgi:pyrroloquinoline-quinone synthase